jgi:uncharacterized protein (DUF58 family)
MTLPILLGQLILAIAGALGAVAAGVYAAQRQDAAARAKVRRSDGIRLEHPDALEEATRETLAQVRRIHIQTRHMSDQLMGGEYRSAFKGRGMEFEEVREYVPGDDVRAIDWNVTARMQRPFVKEFREEREMVVMIVVDISQSSDFGTVGQTKAELAARLAAMQAFAATRNNDKVGLLLFTDRVELYLPPKKGRGHIWRVIREILHHQRHGSGTDVAGALAFLQKVMRSKAVVFLISDFLDVAEWQQPLRLSARKHDLIAFVVSDPREHELPDVGFVAVEDAETGQRAWLDTGSGSVRKQWAAQGRRRRAELKGELRKVGAQVVEFSTEGDVARPLMRWLRARERAR